MIIDGMKNLYFMNSMLQGNVGLFEHKQNHFSRNKYYVNKVSSKILPGMRSSSDFLLIPPAVIRQSLPQSLKISLKRRILLQLKSFLSFLRPNKHRHITFAFARSSCPSDSANLSNFRPRLLLELLS